MRKAWAWSIPFDQAEQLVTQNMEEQKVIDFWLVKNLVLLLRCWEVTFYVCIGS